MEIARKDYWNIILSYSGDLKTKLLKHIFELIRESEDKIIEEQCKYFSDCWINIMLIMPIIAMFSLDLLLTHELIMLSLALVDQNKMSSLYLMLINILLH
jgi:hypothetical protein